MENNKYKDLAESVLNKAKENSNKFFDDCAYDNVCDDPEFKSFCLSFLGVVPHQNDFVRVAAVNIERYIEEELKSDYFNDESRQEIRKDLKNRLEEFKNKFAIPNS